MMNLSRNDLLVILFVWLLATALNVTKPFHIDDGFHLEVATHISKAPLQPYSGFFNWDNVPEPLSQSNQPPLFFYLMAITGSLTSFSEVPLHLLVSVFTLLSLYFFFITVQLIKPGEGRFLTMIFGLSPAFLVNQNVMTDIPLLSATLAFGYFLLKAGMKKEFKYIAYAGIALGIAMLIKFTIVPLYVVLLIAPIFYKKPLHAFAIIIPLAFITGLSLWNLYEFNDIQLFTRSSGRSSIEGIPDTTLSFLSCFGAISPFSLMMFAATRKKPGKYVPIILSLFTAFGIFVLLSWTEVISHELSKEIIRYVFMLLGLLIFITLFLANKTIFSDLTSNNFESYKRVFLVLWFSSLTVFIILFAPFIATRHVLLVLPAFLLVMPALPPDFPKILKTTALSSTLLAGILLSISDYNYAAFYRDQAKEISHKYGNQAQVWSVGHWGWQWYSRVNDLKIYHTCISDVKVGDIIAYPVQVPQQNICPLLKLTPVEKRWDNPGFLSFFSTRHKGSFYLSAYKRPAWRLSNLPTDTIIVQRVVAIEQSGLREHYHD